MLTQLGANPPPRARADPSSSPSTSCSKRRAWNARHFRPVIGPAIYRSIAGRTCSCACRRNRHRAAERIVDLADRTAARFKADEPEGDRSQDVPEGEIVEAGNQRIECRLRFDVVGRAGDQGQPGRADELAEIANAVDKSHA